MRELWPRLVAVFLWRARDRDLQEELQFHLEMKTRETGDRAIAARALGSGTLLVRERARDAWGWHRLEAAWQDLRYAIRMKASRSNRCGPPALRSRSRR
jgi:hypothetical protein